MNRQHILDITLTVLSTVLRSEVNEFSSRETLPNWDSLKHIEIIFAIEDELNIEFPEEQMSELNSVEQIIKIAEGVYAS
jgi:acyl carrier protein